MEITSVPFAFLAVASIFIFYLLNPGYRIAFITALSCIFIASYNYYLVVYLIFYSLINFYLGIIIPQAKFKKALFNFGIIINLTQLVIFKYASFTLEPLFQVIDIETNILKLSDIILPLGISYFTLQGIGYLINIKFGWEKPERNYMNFLLYVVFYPKFLAGPIERSNHFLPQIKTPKPFNEQNVKTGLRIAMFGFFKKVVIANQLGVIVNSVHSGLGSSGGLDLWIGILIQPLYLYFDFSGYTDIAIGLAKTYGIDLLPNFNRPFLSENMTTFWRRFHISLSSWFNDYVYKQTSFRLRKLKTFATIIAVFITWILFGIWHGAGWNFMVLGFIQASAITYEYFTKRKRMEIFSKLPSPVRKWTGRAFTYLFFGTALIFFFSPDLTSAFRYIASLTTAPYGSSIVNFSFLSIAALGLSAVYLAFDFMAEEQIASFDRIQRFWLKHSFLRVSVYYLMILVIIIQIGKKFTFVYQEF
jgi:alginate O-acetyltransferase complex protein AlgI